MGLPAAASATIEVRVVDGGLDVAEKFGTDSSDHLTISISPTSAVVKNGATDPALETIGCTLNSAHQVTCATALESYRVLAGDLDDSVAVTGAVGGLLEGDAGADNLSGGARRELINGGLGVDTLRGNDGNDTLIPSTGGTDPNELSDGGPGDDMLIALFGDGAGDRFIGGPGTDRLVTASDAFAGVSVNLATGALLRPSPAEADSVATVEDVVTHQAGDTVTGSAGPNVVESAADRQFIASGGAGLPGFPVDVADVVDPGAGTDEVLTFAGNDDVRAADGWGDVIRCGAGDDRALLDRFDVAFDCERLTVNSSIGPAALDNLAPRCTIAGVKSTVSTTSLFRGFRVRIGCSEAAALVMRVIARVRRAGRIRTAAVGELVVAESRARLGAGTRRVRLRGSKRLRKALGRSFRVRLRVEGTDAAGNRGSATKRLRVKAPKRRKRG
jgi:hypothetical protein